MSFRLDNDDDDRFGRRPLIEPRNYSSRKSMFRVAMLVAMLVIVIIAMNESGKPEHWMWMGFDEETLLPEDRDPSVRIATNPSDRDQDRDIQSDEATESRSGINLDPSPNVQLPVQDQSNLPDAAREFWIKMVREMDVQDRILLFDMLRSVRANAKTAEEDQQRFESLYRQISLNRKQFHVEVFDRLTMLEEGTEEKTSLANGLFESESVWKNKTQPIFETLVEGGEFTLNHIRHVGALQSLLDAVIYAEVQDNTTIGWKGDSPAWTRTWERAQAFAEEPATQVTHLQLSSQPEYFRGKQVRIEGWVRSGRKKYDSMADVEDQGYFELWLRPADTKLSPYCIYVRQLPVEFPKLDETFQDLNQHVSVCGQFFKLRSFVDAGKQVRESPVIIAERLQPIAEFEPMAVNQWQPNSTTLMLFLVGIPLLAVTIAWAVYRTSSSHPFRPGEKRNREIHENLDSLKYDDRVQTDQEKIKQLYDADINGS